MASPAAEIAATGECIGFVGLHRHEIMDVLPAGTHRDRLAAGARILGQGLCHRRLPRRCSPSASRRCGLNEIVSFAVANNHRSTAVMKRLGMSARPGPRFRPSRRPRHAPASQAARPLPAVARRTGRHAEKGGSRSRPFALNDQSGCQAFPDFNPSGSSRSAIRRSSKPASEARSCAPAPSAHRSGPSRPSASTTDSWAISVITSPACDAAFGRSRILW